MHVLHVLHFTSLHYIELRHAYRLFVFQGKFSDVSGRKKTLITSLIFTGLSYFLVGQSNSLALLALTRIPVGIFKQTQGLCKVSLADITPSIERPKVFGYFNSLASAGFIVGPLIGGHIGMRESGFTMVMTLQSIGFISMAAFAWLFLDVPDNSDISREEIIPKRKTSDRDEEINKDSTENGFKATHHFKSAVKEESKMDSGEKNGSHIDNSWKDDKSTVKRRNITRDNKELELKEETTSSKQQKDSPTRFHRLLIRIGKMLSIESLDSIVDLLLLRFILGFAMIIFRSNFTTMLEFRYQTTPKTNGYILSFNGMISGLSGTLVGYIMPLYNHNDAKAILHFSALITCALFCITFSPDLWVLVCLLMPLSFSTSICRVCVSNVTLKRCKQNEKGVILGVGNSMISFARMLSPLLAGVAQEYSVYGPGTLSIGICSIAVIIAGYVSNY